jgi:hypothetical protein
MNILPKKSWHVRTRKNIERVQRDEAEASRLHTIEQDRRLRAEQEARVRELRIRAGIHDQEKDKHIDLSENFHDNQQSSNPDHEAEERRRYAAGKLNSHLSNSLIRSTDTSKPWYCTSRPARSPTETHKSRAISSIYDPMIAMQHAEQIVREKRAARSAIEVSTSSCDGKRPRRAGSNPESSPEIVHEIKKSVAIRSGSRRTSKARQR